MTIEAHLPAGYLDFVDAETGTVGPDRPPSRPNISEHAQLWLYHSSSEWMAAQSWRQLKANHSAAPGGYV